MRVQEGMVSQRRLGCDVSGRSVMHGGVVLLLGGKLSACSCPGAQDKSRRLLSGVMVIQYSERNNGYGITLGGNF